MEFHYSFISWNAPSVKERGLYYLGMSIMLMADADVLYFARGWQEARGCRVEHEAALGYGLPMIEDQPYWKGEC